MALISALSTALNKSLLNTLPKVAAEKFDLDEDDFKSFLEEFLAGQLKGSGKSTRGKGPRGNNGRGRTSGYIMFCGKHRQAIKNKNPELKTTEITSKLGQMWRKLSDKEKENWNKKAAKENEDNGLGKKGSAPTPKKTPAKKAPKKSPPPKKQPVQKKASTKGSIPMQRNKEVPCWLIRGTEIVADSPNNRVAIGHLKGKKVVPLTAADKKKCAENEWPLADKNKLVVEDSDSESESDDDKPLVDKKDDDSDSESDDDDKPLVDKKDYDSDSESEASDEDSDDSGDEDSED